MELKQERVWQPAASIEARRQTLLFEKAGVAGDALPFSEIEHPCVREASKVLVRLPLIGALSMVDASHHSSVAEEVHLQVLNVGAGGSEPRIFDVGQEFLLIADFSIPLCVYKATGNQLIESGGIAVYLSLVPQALKNQQSALTRIGMLGGQSNRADGQKKATADSAIHFLTRSPASPREANVTGR